MESSGTFLYDRGTVRSEEPSRGDTEVADTGQDAVSIVLCPAQGGEHELERIDGIPIVPDQDDVQYCRAHITHHSGDQRCFTDPQGLEEPQSCDQAGEGGVFHGFRWMGFDARGNRTGSQEPENKLSHWTAVLHRCAPLQER